MWKLGQIDLLGFGLIPSQADINTNLALSGCFDMPGRIGKISHDWGDDEHSIEPYVRAEEMRFGGRDIVFVALLACDTEELALAKCYDLYKKIGGISTLVDFVTEYGTYNVYLKDTIIADYIGDGWCKLKFTFREPILNFSGVIPPATNAGLGIDGISFSDLKLTILDVKGRFNNPAPKNFKSTYFENEGYKVSKLENRQIEIKALIRETTLAAFKSSLNALYSLFAKEGLRYITYEKDAFRDFFVAEGVQISNVLLTQTGEMSALLSVKLIEISAHISDWGFLKMNDGEELTDKLGQKIAIHVPEFVPQVDPKIVVNTTTISVPQGGGVRKIEVESNTEWVVLENADFLVVSDSYGVANGSFTISPDANPNQTRSARIIVSSEAGNRVINVTQAGASADTLSLSISAINAPSTGSTTTIAVTASGGWNITKNSDWFNITPLSGTGNRSFQVVVLSNSLAARNATFSVSSGAVVRTVSVSQSAEASGSTGGEIADIDIPSPAMLNQVDLGFLGEFDMPFKANGKPVIENLYKGLDYREQATVGNVFKKGFTSIEWGMTRFGTERQNYPYNINFRSILDAGKIAFYGSNSYQGIGLDVNATAADILAVEYSRYIDVMNDYKYNIPQIFNGGDVNYKGSFIGMDIENGLHDLPSADYVNRVVAITDAFLQASVEHTDVCLLYQCLPILSAGFGVHRQDYTRPADAGWVMPASMTSNAQAKGMPANLVGKSLYNMSNRIRASFEYYLFYEAYQPEGTIMKNINNTNLTDWGGNDISVLTHFDITKPSYLHWAGHARAGLEIQRAHLGGHKIELRTHNFNGAGNGYYYQDYQISNQPNSSKIKQCHDGLGRYAMPNYMCAGIAWIAIFNGSCYTNWDGGSVLNPADRGLGEIVQEFPLESRKEYAGVGAVQAVFKRAVKFTTVSGNYSVVDLLDGNEIYEGHSAKVDYLTVANFQGIRQPTGLDLIEFKLSSISVIVNLQKGLIAIHAVQPYGVEQGQVDVFYDKNGFNFRKRIAIQPYKNNIYIYSLGENDGGITNPPVPAVVPVFVFAGESNAAGSVPNSTAPSSELGIRNKVKIWNPSTDTFEVLNIGINSNIDNNMSADKHGFELGIANMLDTSYYDKPEVYIIKTAKGGSMVRQYLAEANPRPNYWDDFLDRITQAKAALSAANKTPVFYVLYSQGVNDKINNLIDVNQWGAETEALFVRIRAQLSTSTVVPILMTNFASNSVDYSDYNAKIASIAAAGTKVYVVDSKLQTRQVDDFHWTYAGTKEIAKLFIDKIKTL